MVSFVSIYADASGESQTSISRSSKPLECRRHVKTDPLTAVEN
jgi:hypothetical protein